MAYLYHIERYFKMAYYLNLLYFILGLKKSDVNCVFCRALKMVLMYHTPTNRQINNSSALENVRIFGSYAS